MGCSLRMSEEMHDWLTGLRASDPVAAMLVGEALVALMSADESLRPPLVISPAVPLPADLGDALDLAYRQRLEQLTALRWLAVETAAAPEAGAEAERLAEECRRLDMRTQAMRTRKEVLKAGYTTARAILGIHEASAAADPPGGDRESPRDDGDEIAAATAALRHVTAEIERELRQVALPEGLMELRPGPFGDGEISILFGWEPPGSALLIAVLDGRKAVQDQHGAAVMLSGEVLRQARAGQAPEAAACAYGNADALLAEFYPDNADEMARGAVVLAARNRARTLAEQRVLLGLTQAEVAGRMGVRQERVSAIERAGLGVTGVRTLASYVAALGGHLEVTAEFPDERVPLR